MARQLHLIADTPLRTDRRLTRSTVAEHSASSTVVSTVAKHSASSTVNPAVAEAERKRRTAEWSHEQFARHARIELRNWYKLVIGAQQPTPFTQLKLIAAANEMEDRPPPKPREVIMSFHRLVMTAIAERQGLDVAKVLATDFSTQRPQNPAWRAASEVRLIAIYITAVELEVENPDIAAAIGVSRQAVQKARHRVEDLREDPARDALIEAVTAKVRR